jgi:large-conductance mechanosensitive channel
VILSLASTVVIAGAFSKIISSVVNDVIMPVIGNDWGFYAKFISLDGSKYEEFRGGPRPVRRLYPESGRSY